VARQATAPAPPCCYCYQHLQIKGRGGKPHNTKRITHTYTTSALVYFTKKRLRKTYPQKLTNRSSPLFAWGESKSTGIPK